MGAEMGGGCWGQGLFFKSAFFFLGLLCDEKVFFSVFGCVNTEKGTFGNGADGI